MDTRSRHLLLELHGCDPKLLDDEQALGNAMREAAAAANVNVLHEVFHRYAPQGVTGLLVISESHFSIHTWPEAGYAAVDFYTCGQGAPERALEVVKRRLAPSRWESMTVGRGLSADRSMRVTHRQPCDVPDCSDPSCAMMRADV